MATISFLGLGNMGFPMAGHLLQAGHQVTAYNRTASTAQNWAEHYQAQATSDALAACAHADVVILCVGRDQDVRELLLAETGVLQHLPPNTLVIDHTTTSASLAEELGAHCNKLGLRFADAPVSGGQQGAINGQLSIMLGCNEADFAEIQSLLAPYTKSIERMGEIGAGQKAKMVNQICFAGLIQGLAEGLQFAIKSGLDPAQVMQVVGQGAASSWQLINRHQTMIDGFYEHGFAIDWMRKDLQICLQEAAHNGSSLPITALVDQFYGELQQQGKGQLDTSALLLRLLNQTAS